jgi:hypothetical protein
MKKLWNILSVISVANLVALAALAGWLVKSDRLDMDRIRRARVALVKTISQEHSEFETASVKAEQDQKAAEAAKVAARPPLTAAERLAARVEATELDNQRAQRLKREVLDMQRLLNEERDKLQKEKEQLASDRKAFDDMAAASTAAMTDAQFQKTLAVLESLKPAQALAMLKEMMVDAPTTGAEANSAPAPLGSGAVAAPSGKNTSRAVGYLDAMDEKRRSAIMKELAKTDPKLAAELLERIRKRADPNEFARVP